MYNLVCGVKGTQDVMVAGTRIICIDHQSNLDADLEKGFSTSEVESRSVDCVFGVFFRTIAIVWSSCCASMVDFVSTAAHITFMGLSG